MLVGETRVSSGRAEEKNVLLGGTDDVAKSFGEQFAHPRAAGEDVVIGFELRAGRTASRYAEVRFLVHRVRPRAVDMCRLRR